MHAEENLGFLPVLVAESSDSGRRDFAAFRSFLPSLLQKVVLPSVDDVPDILAELNVVLGLLQQETLDIRHVVVQLDMLPRDVELRLDTAHGDGKCGAVNKLVVSALGFPQMVIETLGNVDTRG